MESWRIMNRIWIPRENRIYMQMVPPNTPLSRTDTADLKQKSHDCSRCCANCSTKWRNSYYFVLEPSAEILLEFQKKPAQSKAELEATAPVPACKPYTVILGRSTRYLLLRSKRRRTWSWKINSHCRFFKSASVWAIRATQCASAKIFGTLNQKHRDFLSIRLGSEFVQMQNIISKRLHAEDNWIL